MVSVYGLFRSVFVCVSCTFSFYFFFFLNSGLFVVCLLVLQVVFEMENEREWSLVNGEIGKFWKEVREEKSDQCI